MYKKPTLAGIFPKPVDASFRDKFIKENIKRVRQLQNEKAANSRQKTREPLKALNAKHFKHVPSVVGSYIKNGDSPDGSARSSTKCSVARSVSTDRMSMQLERNKVRRSESQKPVQRRSLGSTASLEVTSLKATKSPHEVNTTDMNANIEKAQLEDWRAESGIHMYSDSAVSTEPSCHGSAEGIDRVTESFARDLAISSSYSSTDDDKDSVELHSTAIVQERINLPKYLIARKAEIERVDAEKKALAAIDKDCPAGHRMLDDKERKERLKQYEKGRDHVFNEINRLSVTSDTFRVRHMRSELEAQLDQAEAKVEEFSRAKVFVPTD